MPHPDSHEAAMAAVTHILIQLRQRPEWAWYMGWGTESFRLLCRAYALDNDKDPEQYEEQFAKQLHPKKPNYGPDACPHCGLALEV